MKTNQIIYSDGFKAGVHDYLWEDCTNCPYPFGSDECDVWFQGHRVGYRSKMER